MKSTKINQNYTQSIVNVGHWSSSDERKSTAKKVTISAKNDAKGYTQFNKTSSV